MFVVEKFLMLVESKECLWKISAKDYSNRDKKTNAWQEICKEMFPDWEELDQDEKREKGPEVQKKWKNLKDRFQKEVRREKAVRSGSAASKKKKYVYYDIMQFLLPQLESRSTESNIEPPNPPEQNSDMSLSGLLQMTPWNVAHHLQNLQENLFNLAKKPILRLNCFKS
ncbi:unnamed protein product [Ceutorhynchus assimilis]|uniref:MADF domain-containing protein n=1 Tax=Ceutorhynchus assimilis TaxID=467358 RepID=A0A9N9QS68_9CUCU|nr:unnamed protein product [Ceutorhynchus assimilis]